MIAILDKEPQSYQGQFGEYTITKRDRLEVIIYRVGLVVAAASFADRQQPLLCPRIVRFTRYYSLVYFIFSRFRSQPILYSIFT